MYKRDHASSTHLCRMPFAYKALSHFHHHKQMAMNKCHEPSYFQSKTKHLAFSALIQSNIAVFYH